MIKAYYFLTKPGIIYGNVLTASAGFFLAAQGNIDLFLYTAAISGLALIIASGCVFNNYIDRDIDKKMERTKNRALVTGLISVRSAMTVATVLGILGAFVLLQTNILTLKIALLGLFFYVVVYGITKRNSIYGTLVGSISGAVPPVVGYAAVTNTLDLGAAILFAILVTWQMPHFYAIAIFRLKDYRAAGLHVLPIKKGITVTKLHMLFYTAVFIVAVSSLTFFGYTGYLYLVVVGALSLVWFYKSLLGFKAKNSEQWAKKMFGFSLIVILVFSITVSLNSLLPL